MADDIKTGLSFGFSKRTDAPKLKASAINEGDLLESEGKDYLLSVEGRKINSVKPVEEKAPLVIDLIQNNRWRRALKPEDLESSSTDDNIVKPIKDTNSKHHTGDKATDDALNEIIADAARSNDETLSSAIDTSLAIPLLMQNKVPDGFETDDHLDVALRPDEATDEDYEKVPIEQFGMAMLRGMGWKDGEGVGKNKKIVKAIDPVVRPKGLGLGADKSAALQSRDKATTSNSGTTEEDSLEMKAGAFCQVVSGKRDGQYGTVTAVDCENSRVMVSMAVDKEIISISQFAIKLVAKKEFDKYSKYLNKDKVDRYKEEHDKDDNHKHSKSRKDHSKQSSSSDRRDERGNSRNVDHYKQSSSSDRRDEKDLCRDRKYIKPDESDSETKSNRSEGKNEQSKMYSDRKRKQQDENSGSGKKFEHSRPWLRPHLRVRVIDKTYKKGKYYKLKVTVVDVISMDCCICRTDDGHVLEDLAQSQLETVIPRQSSNATYIMIVAGKHQSQLAQLMERDKGRNLAVVQLLSDRNTALTLDFNDICEYAADIAVDDFDY